MPDDANALPLGRLVRWTVIALLLLLGLVLYFRTGLQVAPLTATAPVDSAR
ncbi:MAG TPA: hypothetical protein VN848_01045 [Gemmatimonadales bacterium]|nr:hypothetical protein [Gemmatimonadales bacterium]